MAPSLNTHTVEDCGGEEDLWRRKITNVPWILKIVDIFFPNYIVRNISGYFGTSHYVVRLQKNRIPHFQNQRYINC